MMKRIGMFSAVILILVLAACVAYCQDAVKINLEVKDTPLSEVLQSLFKGTGYNYTIDPSVSALKVTAKLQNVSLDEALRTLVRASGVVYRVDNNVYTISAKTESPAPVVAQRPRDTSSNSFRTTEIVTVKNQDPGDLASILSRQGTLIVTSVAPDKLVLTGDTKAIEDAKAIIRALDTEVPPVRSIRIKLEGKIISDCLKSPVLLVTESVGAVDSQIPLNVASDGTIPYFTTFTATQGGKPVQNPVPNFLTTGGMLFVVLTPTITPDGRISLSGNGDISYSTAVNKAGSPVPDQIRFSKKFEVAASVVADKPMVIATGHASTEGYSATLEITATASLEDGMVRPPIKSTQQTNPWWTPSPPSGGSFGGGYSRPGGGSYGGSGGGSSTESRSW